MDKILNIILYLTVGLVLSTLNLGWGWQWWSLVALLVIIAQRERQQGREETSTVMIIALKNMGVDVDQLIKAMTSEK